jgi:hypothetical protein
MVYGRWSMVYGRWSMVDGLWSMVHGLWSIVYGRIRFVGYDDMVPNSKSDVMALVMSGNWRTLLSDPIIIFACSAIDRLEAVDKYDDDDDGHQVDPPPESDHQIDPDGQH